MSPLSWAGAPSLEHPLRHLWPTWCGRGRHPHNLPGLWVSPTAGRGALSRRRPVGDVLPVQGMHRAGAGHRHGRSARVGGSRQACGRLGHPEPRRPVCPRLPRGPGGAHPGLAPCPLLRWIPTRRLRAAPGESPLLPWLPNMLAPLRTRDRTHVIFFRWLHECCHQAARLAHSHSRRGRRLLCNVSHRPTGLRGCCPPRKRGQLALPGALGDGGSQRCKMELGTFSGRANSHPR